MTKDELITKLTLRLETIRDKEKDLIQVIKILNSKIIDYQRGGILISEYDCEVLKQECYFINNCLDAILEVLK